MKRIIITSLLFVVLTTSLVLGWFITSDSSLSWL